MAKLTHYKTAAIVYDLYVQSCLKNNVNIYDHLDRYNIEKTELINALEQLHIIQRPGKRASTYIWTAGEPTMNMILQVEERRRNNVKRYNAERQAKNDETTAIEIKFDDSNNQMQKIAKEMEAKFEQRFEQIASLLLNQFNNSKQINAQQ